jgi:hypothetical protein
MNGKNRATSEQDPAEIRAEIDSTRADLTETLNAIQQRLSPQRIREDAMSSVRAATVGRVEEIADDAMWKVKGVGDDVFETIKRNPAPAVLAAVGLGWLFMESRNRQGRQLRSRDRYYYSGETYGRPGYGSGYDEYGRRSESYGQFDDPRGHMQQAGQNVRERAGEVVDTATSKVQDAASTASSKVQSAATDVADTAGQVIEGARQGAQQVAQEAQYRAEQVGSRFGEIMDENPLMIGAAALALGAVIGMAFPSTQKENEIFGEARDRVMDRAQEVASETAQKAQRVAEEATSAAKDAAKNEAQRQNLGSGMQR